MLVEAGSDRRSNVGILPVPAQRNQARALVRKVPSNSASQLESAHHGQPEIDERKIGLDTLDQLDAFDAVPRGLDSHAMGFEHQLQHPPCIVLIFDEHNRSGSSCGPESC